MFLIFHTILVMTVSQQFLKKLEHHKTIFIWKQALFLKIICEAVHFLVKWQTVELKYLLNKLLYMYFHRVFFFFLIIVIKFLEQPALRKKSQRAHHVESTSIRRGYYVDTSKAKF